MAYFESLILQSTVAYCRWTVPLKAETDWKAEIEKELGKASTWSLTGQADHVSLLLSNVPSNPCLVTNSPQPCPIEMGRTRVIRSGLILNP